ncbi:transketolase family protein [Kytococcus sp. Marseille-QA3725]
MSTREQFGRTMAHLLDERDDLALVYAEIGGRFFTDAIARHPDRVLNLGIREQLLVSASAGLALTGIRPVAHTFASFLVERAFEQVKLDFPHQGVGGVLVSAGGSFDISSGGRTHQAPGDMALMDTVAGAHLHAPSTVEEADAAVRLATAGEGLHYVRLVEQTNTESFPVTAAPTWHVVRRGSRGTVLALGPVLDAALAASEGLDLTVAYTHRIRPLDAVGLRQLVTGTDVVVVEPWLRGTSAHAVQEALSDRPLRFEFLGVGREELRRYGTPAEHVSAHGLDAHGIRQRLTTRFA